METLEKFNSRIDFLWRTLGYKSSREFDRALGIPETHTSGITGPRQTTPKVDYVQRIIAIHPEVNANWLLVGVDEWSNPPKGYLDDLLKKIESLSRDLDEATKVNSDVLAENALFRNSIVSLAVSKTNFQSAANFNSVGKKSPVNRRLGVIIPFFAHSLAHSVG